jgi:ferric-dicitrate binding protein FerR (iron transport regulator)
MRPSTLLVLCMLTLGTIGLTLSGAMAQTSDAGCVLEPTDGGRSILRCADGLSITVEPGARYSLIDRNSDGKADGAALRSKAVLIDGPAGAAGGFKVITPQAIAAVRGTRWAVDVAGGKTAVFVVRGRVSVQRATGGERVVLRPGEGVDVDRGTGPLTVKRWPAARVSALLARLGQ